jgi:hypothetical protein
MLGASVPEASIGEDRQTKPRQEVVRFACEVRALNDLAARERFMDH